MIKLYLTNKKISKSTGNKKSFLNNKPNMVMYHIKFIKVQDIVYYIFYYKI